MKKNAKFLDNLRNLLLISRVVEKIYFDLNDKVSDDDLKYFFREGSIQRNKFGKEINLEIINLGGTGFDKVEADSQFNKFWIDIRTSILNCKNDESLVDEVRGMQGLCVNIYNELLCALSLPLSTCKLLIRQRDAIQAAMDAIERKELLSFAS